MSFKAIRGNEILAKFSEFTVICVFVGRTYHFCLFVMHRLISYLAIIN